MQKFFNDLTTTTAPKFSNTGFSLTALFTGGSGTFNLLNFAYFIAGTMVLFYLIWGGFEIMISRGDPKAIASGRVRITHAVAGLFIVLLSYALVRLIGYILAIGQITNTLL